MKSIHFLMALLTALSFNGILAASSALAKSFVDQGYFLTAEDQKIPVAIELVSKSDPSSDIQLFVNMRLGFFGAARLNSSPAKFDWVTGMIKASFPRANGENLEFEALLGEVNGEDQFLKGVLYGPNTGANRFVSVSKAAFDFFDPSHLELGFTLMQEGSDEAAASGTINFKRLNQDMTAPATIDLQFLPQIQADIFLDGTAQTPQLIRTLIYDPLAAQMRLELSDNSQITLYDITLEEEAVKTANMEDEVEAGTADVSSAEQSTFLKRFATLSGDLTLSGRQVGEVLLERDHRYQERKPAAIRTRHFKGRLAGTVIDDYVAYAVLNYEGTAGQNTSDMPFVYFPVMRLTVHTCELGAPRRYVMDALDYLNRQAYFDNLITPNRNEMDMTFEPGWTGFHGVLKDNSGTTAVGHLYMRAVEDFGQDPCAD